MAKRKIINRNKGMNIALAIVTIVIIVIAAVLVWGALTKFTFDTDPYCLFGHKYVNGYCVKCGEQEPEHTELANGNVVITKAVERGMRLSAVPAVAAANEEQSYNLTAYVLPDNADDRRVEWSVAWKDSNSVWAIGKTVTDYVTVTPSESNGLNAKVACLQAFGEQVIVTVASLDNIEATATCQVDYVQRITGFTFNMPSVTSTTTSFTYETEYSAYTIAAETSVEVSELRLGEEFDVYFYDEIEYKFTNAGGSNVGLLVCMAPKMTRSGNTLTLSVSDNIPQGYDHFGGVVGCFTYWDEQGIDFAEIYEGDIIAAFRSALQSYGTTHGPCNFDVTYSTKYNGRTYSQGTQTVQLFLDGQALHIPVTGVSLDNGSIVF